MPKIMKEGKVLTSEPVIAEVIYTNQLIQTQEETRQTQETERVNTESTRVTNENARVSAETTRGNNETTRQNQESTRQSQETTRQNYYNAYKVLEAYSGTTAYVSGNKVTYQGSTYQCILNCTGVLPTNTTNWICIAVKGTDGVGGDMMKSSYDTTNKATDVYAYADNKIGDLTQLQTESNTDLVGAINEINNAKKWVSIERYGAIEGQDVSEAIKNALAENDFIYIPNKTYLINPAYTQRNFIRDSVSTIFGAGIDIYQMSNKHIWFDGTLVSSASDVDWIQVINIQESHHIYLYYPKVIGDKDIHLDSIGEWAHGIGIYSSDEVYIYSPNISKTWGDGIYTGIFYHDTSGKSQGHVRIENPKIDDISRNGISITSGENTEIINPIITNVNRIAPMSGIDIEPEGIGTSQPNIENVLIDNPRIEDCHGGSGIILGLYSMRNRDLKINIQINNYLSNSNSYAFSALGFEGELKGQITFNNTKAFYMDYYGGWLKNWHKGLPQIIFNDIIIENANELATTELAAGSGILISNDIAFDIDNICIKNPNIKDTRVTKLMTYPIWIYSGVAGIGNLIIDNPIHLDTLYGLYLQSSNSTDKSVVIDNYNADVNGLSSKQVTITSNISSSYYDANARKEGKVIYVNFLAVITSNYSVGSSLITLPILPIVPTRVILAIDNSIGRADFASSGILVTQTALTAGQTITASFSYIAE